MNESARVDDAEIELAELRSLSAFFKVRKEIAPTGGRALLEFLAAMRSELLELKVTSFCAQILVDAVVGKIDAEFRAVRMRKVAYASRGIPKEKEHTVACWQITDEMCFGILAAQRLPKGPRKYFFRKIDKATGKPQSYDFFRELPSRAIGNTFVSASDGNPNAINNYAVLLYAGVANPNDYEEDEVIELLECAAKAGNATALHNLGVLYENRGEMSEAARRYDEARVQNGLSGKNVHVKP